MATTFTATPDVENARVLIEAQGGVTGERFYMVRRDRAGSVLIRETSEIGALWLSDPAKIVTNLATNPEWQNTGASVVVRTNLCTNSSMENLTGVTATYGTTGAGTLALAAGSAFAGTNIARMTWTTAATATGGSMNVASTATLPVGPASLSVYVRTNLAQRLQLVLAGTAATGATGITNPAVDTVANTWTRITWSGTIATAGTFTLQATAVAGGSGHNWAIGNTLDLDAALAEVGSTVRAWFDGSLAAAGDFTYAWTGTANASTSTQSGLSLVGASTAGAVLYRSTDTPHFGTTIARAQISGTAFVSVNPEDVVLSSGTNRTSSIWVRSSRALSVQPRWYSSTGSSTIGAPLALAANTWTEVKLTAAPAINNASIGFTIAAGSGQQQGDYLDIGEHYTVVGAYTGGFFDGTTGPNHTWAGTPYASVSNNADAALPITLSDYEARQGLETDYILTNEDGVTSSSLRITIPAWGTWLKDPFRPFMNVKVLWNSDDAYVRRIPRVVLQARGAKYPVVQTDKRLAPEGQVRILTEDEETARKLTSLLDVTSTLMLDVDIAFGVPVRYVSVGDLTGLRVASEKDRNLTWTERYWDLPVLEIAAPIGAPIAQNLSYDSIPANFSSYIGLPASVASYNDLAAGNWG